MKDLTNKELEVAPTIVQFLYIRAWMKEPVGSSMIDEAMEKHPEYFPDEIEHRRKYALIPQQVHDAYFEEWREMHQEVYKDMPPSKGLLGWMDDPAGYKEWNESYAKFRPIEIEREVALHKKHYEPYGI